MPLYVEKPKGFYASGGNWSDPSIWTDEKGNATNAVPTSSDNVYITGSISGSGSANNVTFGSLAEIGGNIVRRGTDLGVAQACCCSTCGKCCWTIDSAGGCPKPNVTIEHGSPPGVRIEFADSSNCGGPCGAAQSISLSTKYETTQLTTITATGEGLVETQNAPFDILSVTVDGQQLLYLQAYEEGGGCRMKQVSGSGSLQLQPGCHTIAITSGTNDALYHVGFYYKVTFSTSPQNNTSCESKICNQYNCDPTYGCQEAIGGGGTYPTLAACEAECDNKKRYYCNQYQGCGETYDQNAPYASLSECEAACVEAWFCNQQSGCVAQYGSTAPGGGYSSQSACESACFQAYACQTYGCGYIGYYDNPQNYMTQSQCEAACYETFYCNQNQGCTSQGYATTGDNLQQCQSICTVQAYNCNYDSGCVPVYNNSGEFNSLGGCNAVCQQRATCDTYYGCQYAGYGTSGNLYSNCAQDCQILSYNCDTNSGCTGLYNSTAGQYADATSCGNVCLQRYDCAVYYNYYPYCTFVGYAASGQTLAECQADCTIKSYDCNGGCVALITTSGAFATAGDCQAVCLPDYQCYYNQYCWWTGSYSLNAQSQEACLANCPPQQMRMAPESPDPTTVTTWTPVDEKIRAALTTQNFVSSKPPPPSPKTLEEQDPIGPGTFLSKMLEKVGIKSSPTCSCKARARSMNENGNDWCEQNIDMIVGWLREEAEKRKLPFVDIAGTLLVKRAISLSRAAKKKQAKNESKTPPRTDS